MDMHHSNDNIEPEDYVIMPSGHLGTRVYVGVVDSRGLGEFPDEDAARAAIKKDMEKNNFFPNVWVLSDHGNLIG